MYLTHPLILLTTLLPTLPLTTASPAPLSLPRPIPSPDTTTTTTPWHLNNITLFRAAPGVGASYIHFQFQDTRPGFRLKTDCRRFVLPGEVPGIDDAETTYGCANGTVGFGFDRGRFEVTRSYIDESIGDPPQDRVTAFGGATAELVQTKGKCGRTGTLGSLPVQITAMIA